MRALQGYLLSTSWMRTTIYALGMCGYALIILSVYDSIRSQAAAMDELLKSYPEALMKAFGLGDGVRFGQLPDYLGTEIYGFAWLIAAIALALTIGSSSVAGEVESGNMGSWLATGISRLRFLLAHWLSFAVQAGAMIAGTTLGIVIGTFAQGIDPPWSGLWAVSIHGAVFALAVYAVACACSAIYSERGAAARLAVGIVFLSYAQSVVSSLSERVDWLHTWTLFALFDPIRLLRSGSPDAAQLAAGGSLVALLLGFTWWRFGHRDLALG